jgi:CMP/dCMP kinase
MSKKFIIAIDGPAGSGKSTSAKLVARRLGYLYIDTGAMYRAVTYLALKLNKINDIEALSELAVNTDISLKFLDGKTYVTADGIDITDEIRTFEVNSNVSQVSAVADVRKALVKKQQEMGMKGGGVVMEGRDISTVVFPDADVKIFLTAEIDKRAERRLKEFSEKGIELSVQEVKSNLTERDKIDSTREASPLKKASDAFVVDTSSVTIDEQVDIIIDIIKKTAEEKGIELNISGKVF